ncbi:MULTISPECIES: gamma-glutamylcyclotransferase family protein [Flavobacterium]|uniref:AIG2-like family protein n=2 Tax=Flavobacterium TaxID=237 RepID=A0A2N9P766_9FLAO|nr:MULTISPECIES: gamma-glutamylcyclotransferase family protein [Flavobacterium]QYS89488.1 gamma-glutamylcyclotransferase [Flavobacterium davisii]RVU91509.1 gamma-glutamylcyclotransferase [Flavobacterium columnare]SPE76188.1 AIG2-like family protein [Flavobacterium columnare]
MKNTTHLLFSYGTLQLEKVQLENYGRLLVGTQDVLKGYKIENLQITDTDVLVKSDLEYHPIALKTGVETDCIKGIIYEISNIELEETDKYEVAEYHRILETFESGKKAWVYVACHNKR